MNVHKKVQTGEMEENISKNRKWCIQTSFTEAPEKDLVPPVCNAHDLRISG